MHAHPWNPTLHDQAKRRAAELREQAMEAAFKAMGQALRRWLGARQQPEA